ncbi:hypothetical protein DDB_G0283463 [Dictyostelium discoideum AX4]|uniref:Putative uncharacterized protein DDB_G0283463 n=1 Tax=Dictyostelium discoideum TaxID=44689 RepID=Y5536_DICDI|nr:hypothetical protein DDB_G0283463 [Dictyostelium discoideum AX4]Q54R00.1 RecName: Full=Putative uncharacterized protein DDB_G0283463 [Dictyostelium discoideum]EAL65716.1 hypothetical protein DDB_G0283463 [Dictyostelium discoideum AX4]|eukprot:XP_639091.1 hypothetical protein DDB_G0283463 [Dictyostelium discoideum AX4]
MINNSSKVRENGESYDVDLVVNLTVKIRFFREWINFIFVIYVGDYG